MSSDGFQAVEERDRRRAAEAHLPAVLDHRCASPSSGAGCAPSALTSQARALIAVNDIPGGSIRPFCEPPITRSTPHSSMRKSYEASDEIVSTR